MSAHVYYIYTTIDFKRRQRGREKEQQRKEEL